MKERQQQLLVDCSPCFITFLVDAACVQNASSSGQGSGKIGKHETRTRYTTLWSVRYLRSPSFLPPQAASQEIATALLYQQGNWQHSFYREHTTSCVYKKTIAL